MVDVAVHSNQGWQGSGRGQDARLGGKVWLWLLLAGAVGVVLGALGLQDDLRVVARAERASGMVVGVVRHFEGDRDAYYPVVRFRTAGGQLVEFEADQSAGDPRHYRVGQPVGILYDPGNPRDARLDTWVSRWDYGAILAALGLFIMVVGAVLRRQGRPRAQQRSLRRQLPARLLGQGEELLVVTPALSGPPLVLFWAPFASPWARR